MEIQSLPLIAINVNVIYRRKPYQIYNSFFEECQCCLAPVAIGANIMRHLRWSESDFTANIVDINVDKICRLRENKSVFTANIENHRNLVPPAQAQFGLGRQLQPILTKFTMLKPQNIYSTIVHCFIKISPSYEP